MFLSFKKIRFDLPPSPLGCVTVLSIHSGREGGGGPGMHMETSSISVFKKTRLTGSE